MKNALFIICILLTFACQAQVNVTGKSFRTASSDSTHGELNGTEYFTFGGKYRYKQGGVWYYRASTADIASALSSITASNGLTKTGNAIRLGGNLTSNTVIGDNGGGQFLDIGLTGTRLGALRGWAANISFDGSTSTTIQTGSQSLTLSTTVSALNGATTNIAGTSALNLSSSGGNVTSTTKHFFTPGATRAGMNWGSVTADPSSLVDGDAWYRSDLDVYRGHANGTTITFGTGTGTIGGTIAATQVGYGSGANTLTSEAAFNYVASTNTLSVDNITPSAISTQLNLSSLSGGGVGITSPSGGTGINITATSGDINLGGNNDMLFATTNNITISANTGLLQLQSGSGNANLYAEDDVTIQADIDDLILDAGDDIIIQTVPTNNNALTSLLGRNSSTGAMEERTVASITTAPAGSNTQVQYNNSGAFGADADFIYDNVFDRPKAIGWMAGTTGSAISNATQYNATGIGVGADSGGAYSISASSAAVQIQTLSLLINTSGSGDITLATSAGGGQYLIITGLPTSSAGLPSGAVYSNAGVLTIVP